MLTWNADSEAERWMTLALRQAELAERRGEVPVGAVLVHDGSVLVRSRNAMVAHHDPTAHAEVEALRKAGRKWGNYRLVGTTLVVTLEPCLMCWMALVHARVQRLVFGARDPRNGALSCHGVGDYPERFNHRIEVVGGVLESVCSDQLRRFFRARRGAGAVERGGLENR